MVVLYKNEMYELAMPYLLFESWKRTSPTREVKLLQLTTSTYKKEVVTSINEVEDYSIARNLQTFENN